MASNMWVSRAEQSNVEEVKVSYVEKVIRYNVEISYGMSWRRNL